MWRKVVGGFEFKSYAFLSQLFTHITPRLTVHFICHRHTLYRAMHYHYRSDQSGRRAPRMTHKITRPTGPHKGMRHDANLSLTDSLSAHLTRCPTRWRKPYRVCAGPRSKPLPLLHLIVCQPHQKRPQLTPPASALAHQSFGSTSAA